MASLPRRTLTLEVREQREIPCLRTALAGPRHPCLKGPASLISRLFGTRSTQRRALVGHFSGYTVPVAADDLVRELDVADVGFDPRAELDREVTGQLHPVAAEHRPPDERHLVPLTHLGAEHLGGTSHTRKAGREW
eukprot:gene2741-biopygen23082